MKNFSVAFLLFFCANSGGAFAFVPSTAEKNSLTMNMAKTSDGVALAFQDKLSTYPSQSLSNTDSTQLTAIHREQQRIPNARQISISLPPSSSETSTQPPSDNRSQLTRRKSPQEQSSFSPIPPAHEDMLSPYSKLSLSNTDSQTISGCIRRGGSFRARG